MTVPIYYFAYGSNLDVGQMRERCPRSELWQAGHVAGYALAFGGDRSHWGIGGTATIVSEVQRRVVGMLYHLHPHDLPLLNGFEGHPEKYRHLAVPVLGQDGAIHEALTYQKVTHEPNPPPIKYFHRIWRAYKQHRLDETHLLEAIEQALNVVGQGAGPAPRISGSTPQPDG